MITAGNKKGFTLVEVIVATIIGTFIALIGVSSLRTVTRARHAVEENIGMADELRYAANRIRTDIENLYRTRNPKQIKIIGTVEGPEGVPMVSLTMQIVSAVKARPLAIEGDVYEVQYFVKTDEKRSVLMRRLCPIVGNEERELRQGGILSVVAENILEMQVLYFDDNEWLDVWPEDMDRHPSLIQVTLIGGEKPENDEALLDESDIETKTFIVGLTRTGQSKQIEGTIEEEPVIEESESS